MPTSIAVISQTWQGHVPAYHEHYARAFGARGLRVHEIAFGAPAAPGRVDHDVASPTVLRRIIGRFGLARSLAWWNRIGRALQRARATGEIDAVFFTYLDLDLVHGGVPLFWLERNVPLPWSGVLLHPRAAYGKTGVYAGPEQVFRARSCRSIVVIDDTFVGACSAAWPGKSVIAAPEMADVSAPHPAFPPAAELRRWAGGRKIVGLLGVLSEKKNAAAFLQMARQAQASAPDLCFAIGGELSLRGTEAADFARHRQLLADLPANCRAWTDRLADGGDFNAMVTACDVLFLAYRPAPEHSNVLTKAAYFRKPVIVSEGHLMANGVRRFGLGAVVPPGDGAAALAAVRELAGSTRPRDFTGFYAGHSEERLGKTVDEVISSLGRDA